MRYRRNIHFIISFMLVLCMLSGCEKEADSAQGTIPQLGITEDILTVDGEIQKAIALGFVPENLQTDYDSQIRYAEYCSILDRFITEMFPERISEWQNISEKYHDAQDFMSRMEGAMVLLYFAECCGVDDVGYESNIPLEDLISEDVNFYENVSWDYPLLPDFGNQTYYNKTIAESEFYSWRCGIDYAETAKLFAEYMSYGNGKTYFDYDERYSLNLGSNFTRGDAICAVERFYENARFAQYIPCKQALCTVSESVAAMAKQMPEASWNQLPKWNGYTVTPGNWRSTHGAGMLYEKELIEVLGKQGFDFVRAPLDSRMIFLDSDMSMVNPAYLETMDDLIEYCAAEGIHVCFDLHDMPGFYTGGDDSQITLWNDEETQKIFVEFWRFLAEYYKDIPSNLLSFNLLNEPHSFDGGPSDEVYSEIMLRAIHEIRNTTPDRLIFVDMLGGLDHVPVQGLANAQVVQTVHSYILRDGTSQWPVYTINSFMHIDNGVLTLNGTFAAGTKITIDIASVHGNSTFHIEADEKSIASMNLGTDAAGENGCVYIGEEGTDGEYRDYEGVFFVGELTEDCNRIELVQQNGCWYNVNSVMIETDKYNVILNANNMVVSDETVPVLIIDEKGGVAAEKEGTMVAQSRDWLESYFENFQNFKNETGSLIMVQEFGFNETIDHQTSLAAADDLLSVLDEYDIPWCSWTDGFGPLIDRRAEEWNLLWEWGHSLKKEGAEYQMVSENWMIDTALMEVYQKYMK